MYTVICLFRVPRPSVDAFSRVQREAGEVYKCYGALDDETLAPFTLEVTYGCAGFASVVELTADEELWVGLSRFRDRDHHDAVMVKVDADPQINDLYAEMPILLDIRRVVRGKFGRA